VSQARPSEVLQSRSGRLILAHEFTHALQDQHFHIDRRLEYVDNSDAGAAFGLVREGDAVIAEYGYDADKMDVKVLDEFVAQVEKETRKPQIGSIIVEGAAIAIYAPGVKFVAEAYRRGGWKAVDDLYSNPPRSMHQVLHPADYFDHLTPPVDVRIKGFETALPEWTLIDRDTYGEPGVRGVLERNEKKPETKQDAEDEKQPERDDSPQARIAANWAGDQVVVLRSKDNQIAAIWMVVFSSSDFAEQFTDSYTKILDKLLDQTPHRVERRNNAVLVVAGVDGGLADKAVWANSTTGGPRD
jgi:hypothetical protein